MTEVINDAGVNETVAESSEQSASNQEINWKQAQEALAEQKRAMDELKQQNMTYQQQLQVFQNYMNQQQAPKEPDDSFGDEDLLTGADLKKALKKTMSAKEKELQGTLSEMQAKIKLYEMRSRYSDYDEVVKNTLNLAKQDPALAEAIQTSSNPHLLAYQLGRGATGDKSKASVEAQKIVENAQKPGSLSAASAGSQTLSKVDYFANMSDADFEKHIAKVKYGF